MWDEITRAISRDFADLTDPTQLTHVILRLTVAGILGGLLGYERERMGKAAGLHTHILVCMGAAFFVIAPSAAGMEELGRVIQGVAAGVGFLGAGAILKQDSDKHIQGLTTAAGIWLTAAVGVATGMGHLGWALVATLLSLSVQLTKHLTKP